MLPELENDGLLLRLGLFRIALKRKNAMNELSWTLNCVSKNDGAKSDNFLTGIVFHYQSLQKSKMSLAELLFGLNMKETGIKRYPLRTRQRTLQYAITLVFQEYDQK